MNSISLESYHLDLNERLFAMATLTGGVLVQRHWSQSNVGPTCSRWGHRTIAVIEAVPILGGIVALIETVVMSYFTEKFNVPTVVTLHQLIELKIHDFVSDLPEYADSIFEIENEESNYIVTRWRKNEALCKSVHGPLTDVEGCKIRSFCLELLSNLEDAEASDIILYIVNNFLQNFAWEKKAGLNDFVHLLKILKDKPLRHPNSQKIHSILLHHFGLAQCLKKILKNLYSQNLKNRNFGLAKPRCSKSNFSRTLDISPLMGRWTKLRIMIQTGLFTPTIEKTAGEAREKGLSPIPSLPTHQTIVNLYPTLDAINLLNKDYREAGRWLIHHTRIVTFRELCQSIKKSCHQLSETVSSWNDFCLITIPGKSQKWMADISYRFLPKMPKKILPMDDHQPFPLDIFIHSDHFLLFDDCCYSGRQLTKYFSSLRFNLDEAPAFNKTKHLVIVIGFSNHIDWGRQLEYFEKHNLQVRIIVNSFFTSCGSMMTPEDVDAGLREQIRDLGGRPDRPIIATEWKMPDFMSTTRFVTRGYTYNHNRNLRYSSSEDLYKGLAPITDVVSPYPHVVHW